MFSGVAGQWLNTTGDANIVPMIANGLVYVTSDKMLTIFGLGGGSKMISIPEVTPVEMRPRLTTGEHELYGTVQTMRGEFVTIRTRKGYSVRIDTTGARHASRYAQPSLNHALLARERYSGGGNTFLADTVQHAMNRPAMWPPDR